MSLLATISAVTLNQFALDFEGNYRRILKSIEIAKSQGSRFRSGPELEICAYSCEDHYYESDTTGHCWEVLVELLQNDICQGILVDVGMPVFHNGVTYNCRVLFLNKQILFIRPKMVLCDNGNYRETRWFNPWTKKGQVENFYLPSNVVEINGQTSVLIGDALLVLEDTTIGFVMGEELWAENSSHIQHTLAGAEIIMNSSALHTEIRKANHIFDMMISTSSRYGGLFAFSNLRGCDGERLYFSGSSATILNGKVIKLGEQYSLMDVEVLTTSIDIKQIREYRSQIVSNESYTKKSQSKNIFVSWSLTPDPGFKLQPALPLSNVHFCSPVEEVRRGPALWLWDYLRRTNANGFLVPLSGGLDSSSVALIVYSMCDLILEMIKTGHTDDVESVMKDLRKVLRTKEYIPTTARDLCSQILNTCYMGSRNSSQESRTRAENLAKAIGSSHSTIDISSVVEAFTDEATKNLGGTRPEYTGTRNENLALQNVQARSRMVYAYFLAQLKKPNGFLLVLGTTNADEAIRGNYTKYDCSAADLNPIRGISKKYLKDFLLYAAKKYNFFDSISEIINAPPTGELLPPELNEVDEICLGMTYDELSTYGKLRKTQKCGVYSMVAHLLHDWGDKFEQEEIARKVKHFYTCYATHRHKMATLTASVHMENYSPDDHRFDHRPILYPLDFTWQFRKIEELIKRNSENNTAKLPNGNMLNGS